jgi:hypothetical protein
MRNTTRCRVTCVIFCYGDPGTLNRRRPADQGPPQPVEVLQVPTRKQARFDVRFDVVSMLRAKPGAHRGLVLNISAGGLLVECAGLPIRPGDDVTLSLPIPGLSKPVEGRARVVRTPVEEHIGLRFEAFAGDGDASVRHFLETLAAQQSPTA